MTNKQQPSEEELRKEFIKRWTDVQAQGEQKKKMGSQLQREGVYESDLAELMLRATSYMPPSNNLETLIDYGERLNNAQNKQILGILNYIDPSGTAFYTTGSPSIFQGMFSDDKIQILPPQGQKQVTGILIDLDQLLERYKWQEQVLEEMERFGFNQNWNGQRVITQFSSAWLVHEQSSSSSTSSLIPMREAINFTIDELFRRRPIHKDEKGKIKKKIIEIGKYAAKDGITLTDFERLQGEWDESKIGLNDKLSIKEPIDRQRERQLMKQATLFLSQLLNAVDPNKLKERR